MALPRFVTLEDLKKLVRYLSSKPSGATVKEAKAALGQTLLDQRKLAAAELLGMIVREGERMKLTPDVGRVLSRRHFSPFLYLEVRVSRPRPSR